MGYTLKIVGRAYEDYPSLKKYLRHQYGDRVEEYTNYHKQLSTAALIEVSNKGTTPITVTYIGKVETNLQVISSGADAALEHAVITAHYLDQDGVAKTATIADASADMSGATDFDVAVTDFYCWDIETYGLNAFTSSLAVGGGLTLGAGVTGTGYAQIIATALVGTKLSYVGVGTIYGQEVGAANADSGFIITLNYLTPWGKPMVGAETINANGDLQGQFILDSDGFPVQAYYRTRLLSSDNAMVDEFELSNYAVNAFYGVIDIGNYHESTSHFMALGAAYGRSFFGEIEATWTSIADVLTVNVEGSLKGHNHSFTVEFDHFVEPSGNLKPFELQPLSEVTVKIKDQNVAHANANVFSRYIDVVPSA